MNFKPINDRVFLIGRFKDRNGHKCSLQSSSLATEKCIWLGVDEPNPKSLNPGVGWEPYPLPKNVKCTTRMHLTRDMVRELIPALQHFVETGELPQKPKGFVFIPNQFWKDKKSKGKL